MRIHSAHSLGTFIRRIHSAHSLGAFTRRIHSAHSLVVVVVSVVVVAGFIIVVGVVCVVVGSGGVVSATVAMVSASVVVMAIDRSLIRLFRTARFARALRCAHSFARSLTHSLPSSWGSGLCLCNECVGFIQFRPTVHRYKLKFDSRCRKVPLVDNPLACSE